jgi:hypothetical protein
MVQPRLKRLSSDNTDPVTQALVESPATNLPPVNDPLAAAGSSDAGLQFYEQYIRELDEYRNIFNKNMKNKPVKHDRVQVLIWTWGDNIDDLGVKDEVRNDSHITLGFLS